MRHDVDWNFRVLLVSAVMVSRCALLRTHWYKYLFCWEFTLHHQTFSETQGVVRRLQVFSAFDHLSNVKPLRQFSHCKLKYYLYGKCDWFWEVKSVLWFCRAVPQRFSLWMPFSPLTQVYLENTFMWFCTCRDKHTHTHTRLCNLKLAQSNWAKRLNETYH